LQSSVSDELTQVVNQAPTTTKISSSLNPSTYGQSVTFTATISPGATNDATVSFYNGGVLIGNGFIKAGTATFTTSSLPAGADSITAAYASDTSYGGSASSALTQAVNPVSTTTTLASSLNPSTYGQAVAFTATVSPSAPDGATVTFYNGAVSIGTAVTVGGTATLTTSTLPAGSDSITATFAGNGNYTTSTSSALPETVNQITTSITVASSLNPSTFGANVTFTATLTPSVTLAETVSFYDGSALIGKGFIKAGIATYTMSTLARGSHSITAAYAGDQDYKACTSSVLTQSVGSIAPDAK
jgi:hypothetical protein